MNVFHFLRQVVGFPQAPDGGQQTQQDSSTDLLVLTVLSTQIPVNTAQQTGG